MQTRKNIWQFAASGVAIFLAVAFTTCWISWSHLARNRSIFPEPALGRIYPLPYRRLTVYVTKLEYMLAGPPMWIVIATAFVVAVTLDIVRRHLKNKHCGSRA